MTLLFGFTVAPSADNDGAFFSVPTAGNTLPPSDN